MLPVAMLSLAVLVGGPPGATAAGSGDVAARVRTYVAEHMDSRASFLAAHANIPSFARQTGLACSACHTAFPQLTAFGRLFKLNGYTMVGQQVIQAGDSGQRESLKLNLIPPISAMVQTSYSAIKTGTAGTQNGAAQFPQQLSLFVGGEITPKIGTFLQLTYSGNGGAIAMDNAELRYADKTQLGSKDLLYGLTLNNNPTNQDVWNTVPAWRYPYATSADAPTPGAAPLLEGALAQQVAGLGAYAMYDGHLYAEYTAYGSAPQGGAHPLDSTAANTISGVASYWRAFYQQTWGNNTLMLGTFGLSAKLFPTGTVGALNRYSDVALDGQFESKIGSSMFTAHGSWLRETQNLDAAFAANHSANATNTLKSLRLDAGILTPSRVGVTVGYFGLTGTSDAVLYGNANGLPDSRGVVAELSYLPWLNTRFSVQYVAYDKFDGASTNYDGAGRAATANNSIYVLGWVAF